MDNHFTHVDAAGNARMVDVGEKAVTHRTAVAVGRVTMSPECFAAVAEGRAKKGDVLATLYTNKAASLAESEAMFLRALSWSEEKPEPETLIFDIIR